MKALLPKNLGKLADLCPKEARYFAFVGVRLTTSDTGYQAEVTDGRMLVRVKGEQEKDCPDYQNPAIETAPNGANETTIPAKTWKEAFKSVEKCHSTLSVVQSPEITTLV